MVKQNNEFMPIALNLLTQVVDLELQIDVVNLGLIYDVKLDNQGSCLVVMTLTMLGCPLTDYLKEQIEETLLRHSRVKKVNVEIIFEPRWSVQKMSQLARLSLGIHV